MDTNQAQELRKPFPPGSVGKLPKGGIMLDYVGHAAVTDRLLTIDPEWVWDFALHRADGTPLLDDGSGNLWIRLTVCGVTRIGVGDGKNAKERIGDAIRNAAMRFGVALDLWSKEELESGYAEHVPDQPAPQDPPNPTAKDAAWAAAGLHETDTDARMAVLIDALGGVHPSEATPDALRKAAGELNKTAPERAA